MKKLIAFVFMGFAIAVTPFAQTEMVRIQGGTFQMGSDNGYDYDEEPEHRVTISSFYMGKYEVTQKEYKAIMGANPSSFKGDNLPVDSVSWYEALVYCNKLSIKEGLSPAYRIKGSTNPSDWGTVPLDRNDPKWDTAAIVAGSNGYRLPTEAQWEYAAKGGNPNAAGWKEYTYSGSNDPDAVAWYSKNSEDKTHEVGKKAPNGLGLYDMSGNVWEWCWDWYGRYSGRAQTDPLGAASGYSRVIRGGARADPPPGLLLTFRNLDYPGVKFDHISFRLARP